MASEFAGTPVQEPEFRMPDRYILGSSSEIGVNIDRLAMTASDPVNRGLRPFSGVPVFRRDRQIEYVPSEIDQRRARDVFASSMKLAQSSPAKVWESLTEVTPNADRLARNSLFPGGGDQAAAPFDMLRTRLLQGLAERGWSRIAVTSPTHGCGKSFVALNLAFSLARRPQSRTALLDLDLRRPAMAGLLGLEGIPPLEGFLSAEQPLEAQFRRFGRTLALGLNGQAVTGASELLHHPETASALASMHEQLAPDVVLYDMPPALVCDDVVAMAGQVDAVLLVTDGTRTSPADIRACERLFGGHLPLMGVVLNRAQDRKLRRYRYGRG